MRKQQFNARLIEKKVVAENTYLMKFEPSQPFIPYPGQFVMVSPINTGHFLKRPISIHYYYRDSGNFKFLIRPLGRGTDELVSMKFGDRISVIGPLGNGFPIEKQPGKTAIIAGGIGYAPFAYLLAVLKERGAQPHLFYGEKKSSYLVEYWRHEEISSNIFTDDGSAGKKGYITEGFSGDFQRIYLCGPMAMVRDFKSRYPDLSKISYASLESHMGCGVGACKGCNINTLDGIKYVCSDGPVFPLDILFDQNS